jgi:AAA15 family ATPase/GTPase
MKVKSIQINNLKGFVNSGQIQLSPSINILVGANNSGKSTILKACYLLQAQSQDIGANQASSYLIKNRRKGINNTDVIVLFDKIELKYIRVTPQIADENGNFKPEVVLRSLNSNFSAQIINIVSHNPSHPFPFISNREPYNFIYPFFSKRKSTTFTENININNAIEVKEDFQNLYAKISRISNTDYPANPIYRKACQEILRFNVSSSLSTGGIQAGLIVSNLEYIPLDEMGEGTTNLLGLIVDLCIAEDKLFLIEELENDIHPKALKALLELIIEKSETNQFIISTHSNIVTKQLGGKENSKIFQVEMNIIDRMPTSTINEVPNTPESRIKVLKDLGYELYDFEMWQAYLILEESSAERIIRDFLIPIFVPELITKLKTIAANGVDDLEPRFNDFLRLFVFIHTTNTYKDKAWIYADGDKAGLDSVAELKSRFETWDASHFNTFTKLNFEEYYPERFKEKADKALAIQNKTDKFRAKGELVKEVINWANANKNLAATEFSKSAEEVISILISLNEKI